MPVVVTPTRNPNPSRVSNPLWWFVCQMLANWPGSTNSGTFAPKTGSHDTRNNQSADNYSCRDPLNKLGPGDKAAAFDQSFPTTAAMVEMGQVVAAAYNSGDPRAYALFEALGEADWDYDPEGYVFYPSKRIRVPDRSHKTHWHWGLIRLYMGEDSRSWKAMRDLASLLCREALAVWQAGRSIFADPATRKDEDMQPVLIRVGGKPTIFLVTMGQGHLPIASPEELKNWQAFMAANNMNTQIFDWADSMAPIMGPDLRNISAVGVLAQQVAANNAAEQARDAGTAAAIGALAQTIERLASAGGGSIEAGALVEAVTDAVREAASGQSAAMQAVYDELVRARAELEALRAAALRGAQGQVGALDGDPNT
jgi:hypothetical protein